MRTRTRLVIGAIATLLATFLAVEANSAQTRDRADAWVTTKVKIALLTEPNVDGLDINVDTNAGRVTLHGVVSTDLEKGNAEQVARATEGVREVRNLLRVAKRTRPAVKDFSDAELKKSVESALRKDDNLGDSHIDVKSVSRGSVVLGGSAASLSDERRAVEVAHRVDGVRHVSSRIESPDRVAVDEAFEGEGTGAKMSSTAKDAWITAKTKLAFMADPNSPAMDINVDTRDGVVTLFGTVATPAQKRAAQDGAKKIEGVLRVENDIQVVPAPLQERVEARDDEIQKRIQERLEARNFEGANINVQVESGVARLTGKVRSQADRFTALAVARAVPGVRSALDDLKVERVATTAVRPANVR
jgi:osmotically-inducible protein OsmY